MYSLNLFTEISSILSRCNTILCLCVCFFNNVSFFCSFLWVTLHQLLFQLVFCKRFHHKFLLLIAFNTFWSLEVILDTILILKWFSYMNRHETRFSEFIGHFANQRLWFFNFFYFFYYSTSSLSVFENIIKKSFFVAHYLVMKRLYVTQ